MANFCKSEFLDIPSNPSRHTNVLIFDRRMSRPQTKNAEGPEKSEFSFRFMLYTVSRRSGANKKVNDKTKRKFVLP